MFKKIAITLSFTLATSASFAQVPKLENRCGWLTNDLPMGELILKDRDAEWFISDGTTEPPGTDMALFGNDMDRCACMKVEVDHRNERITFIQSVKVLDTKVCVNDKSLDWEY